MRGIATQDCMTLKKLLSRAAKLIQGLKFKTTKRIFRTIPRRSLSAKTASQEKNSRSHPPPARAAKEPTRHRQPRN